MNFLIFVLILPVIIKSKTHVIASMMNTCPKQLSGEEWILAQRRADYGWGPDTHRALIALYVADKPHYASHRNAALMTSQLEIELSTALIRNSKARMDVSDLSLYIHALLVVGLNPRDFHGVDLVSILEHTVIQNHLSPLAVLALCNAGVMDNNHLHRTTGYLNGRIGTELKAIALKAIACYMESDALKFQQYRNRFLGELNSLVATQKNDGSFGNVYATAHVTQALIASNFTRWDVSAALSYLRNQLDKNVNMLSTYCILLALNSEKVRFVKHLAPSMPPRYTKDGFPTLFELRSRPRGHYVQYSVRVGKYPPTYTTVTLLAPTNATFFDIMRLVNDHNKEFRFTYALDKVGNPEIYSISGIPNDPHTGFYWQLMEQIDTQNQKYKSQLIQHTESPVGIVPRENSLWIYLYENTIEKLF